MTCSAGRIRAAKHLAQRAQGILDGRCKAARPQPQVSLAKPGGLAFVTMESFIRGLPKAELHLHIEGTLEPEMAFNLAAKHGIALPYNSLEAMRAAYQFTDLKSFLDIYYAGASVLRDAEDFHALASAYLRKAHEQGIVHVEIFFDPQTHTGRGIAFDAVTEGITSALRDAERSFGISHRLIMCFLRDLSAESAMQMLEAALGHRRDILAVGLDSAERGNPPSKFTAVFDRARAEGLLAVAHAGEEGPPSYIVEALELLKVRRIDHGVRCEEDAALVARLARERIPLTVCPLSNVKLKVVDRLEDHNLKRLLDRGLCITINSDDPAYFGGYLLENFLAIQPALGLSRQDIATLAANSIEASFLPSAEKRRWIESIARIATADAPQS